LYTTTSTSEIYTLSLHDALPISCIGLDLGNNPWRQTANRFRKRFDVRRGGAAAAADHVEPAIFRPFLQLWGQRLRCFNMVGGCRSEEHTSELQSLRHLVCRLLLE